MSNLSIVRKDGEKVDLAVVWNKILFPAIVNAGGWNELDTANNKRLSYRLSCEVLPEDGLIANCDFNIKSNYAYECDKQSKVKLVILNKSALNYYNFDEFKNENGLLFSFVYDEDVTKVDQIIGYINIKLYIECNFPEYKLY